jgi:hypothetical protein
MSVPVLSSNILKDEVTISREQAEGDAREFRNAVHTVLEAPRQDKQQRSTRLTGLERRERPIPTAYSLLRQVKASISILSSQSDATTSPTIFSQFALEENVSPPNRGKPSVLLRKWIVGALNQSAPETRQQELKQENIRLRAAQLDVEHQSRRPALFRTPT